MLKNFTASSIFRYVIIILIFPVALTCRNSSEKQKPDKQLTIFHAGSLSVPFASIAEEFEQQNEGVIVNLEAAGSVTCVRKITDLGRKSDILVLADYSLIDRMMIPEHADWAIMLAGNELCLAFTEDSRHQDKINRENWMQILQEDDVRYGRSDPDSDPCGYRTVLSLKLADKYFDQGLDYQAFLEKDRRYIRPKETDLLALLETNTIDYIFIYKSVAVQHKLKYINFSDSINLGNPSLAQFYSGVSVEIAGQKPGDTMLIRGQAMVYGFTIPNCSENPVLARTFAEFLISQHGGLKILEESGQKSIKLELSGSSLRDPGLFE